MQHRQGGAISRVCPGSHCPSLASCTARRACSRIPRLAAELNNSVTPLFLESALVLSSPKPSQGELSTSRTQLVVGKRVHVVSDHLSHWRPADPPPSRLRDAHAAAGSTILGSRLQPLFAREPCPLLFGPLTLAFVFPFELASSGRIPAFLNPQIKATNPGLTFHQVPPGNGSSVPRSPAPAWTVKVYLIIFKRLKRFITELPGQGARVRLFGNMLRTKFRHFQNC